MSQVVETLLKELRDETMLGSASRIGWSRKSIGFDKEEAYLELILSNTVTGDPQTGQRRSNSVIVFGIPGSGKTTLVESALAKLDKNTDFYNGRRVVRLDGLLCPDFRSAIEEICYSLNFKDVCEWENEDENAPMEGFGELANNFDDRLEQVMELLRTKMEKLNKSLVFILDKLDLFAEHPNQRLLYNLYDLAANSKSTIPICIIGITDRVDVLELFEKRVKSRFSHRNINLVPKYSFDQYKEIALRLIGFQNPDLTKEKMIWNENAKAIFANNRVLQILRAVYDADSTILKLNSFLFSILILVQDKLDVSHFEKVYEDNLSMNDPVKLALDLPVTDLVVILSIYKQIQTNKQKAWQPSNLFKIVEKIMHSFGQGKDEYLKSINKLETLHFIVPVSNMQRNLGGVNIVGDIYYKCELTHSEFQEIWKKYPRLPSSFQEFL